MAKGKDAVKSAPAKKGASPQNLASSVGSAAPVAKARAVDVAKARAVVDADVEETADVAENAADAAALVVKVVVARHPALPLGATSMWTMKGLFPSLVESKQLRLFSRINFWHRRLRDEGA